MIDEPDKSNSSIFKADMPGIMTHEEIIKQVNFHDIRILFNQKVFTLKVSPLALFRDTSAFPDKKILTTNRVVLGISMT